MGRGWQNVERTASDVTEAVLAQARQYAGSVRPSTGRLPAAADLDALRERLIGRLVRGSDLIRGDSSRWPLS